MTNPEGPIGGFPLQPEASTEPGSTRRRRKRAKKSGLSRRPLARSVTDAQPSILAELIDETSEKKSTKRLAKETTTAFKLDAEEIELQIPENQPEILPPPVDDEPVVLSLEPVDQILLIREAGEQFSIWAESNPPERSEKPGRRQVLPAEIAPTVEDGKGEPVPLAETTVPPPPEQPPPPGAGTAEQPPEPEPDGPTESPASNTIFSAAESLPESRGYYRQPLESTAGGVNPNLDQQTVESMIYQAERQAESSGAMTGFLLANIWQRRQRRKLERRLKRSVKSQSQRTDKLADDQRQTAADLQHLQREQSQLARELHRPTVQRLEIATGNNRQDSLLAARPALNPSGVSWSKKETGKPVADLAELPPEAQSIVEKINKIDHHLEHSSWHSIEVDNQTGKAVEQPVFNYGREFSREKKQEVWNVNNEEVAVASGQLAVGTAAEVNLISSTTSSTPLVANMVNKLDKLESTIRETRPLISSTSDLALWVVLLFIIVMIVILIWG